MKNSVKKSVFERLNFVESENTSYSEEYRFEVVEGSQTGFGRKDLTKITKCVLRSVKYDNDGKEKTTLKLLIEAAVNGKDNKPWVLWVKLDGKSYKRYKDKVNCGIDPSKVGFYLLHDPEEEYGLEENDYSWQVCRIKKDAITEEAPNDDDDDIFGKIKR